MCSSDLFQNAAVVGVLTSLVKVAAAAKVIVTARYFGAGDELDAFLIAFLLPTFVVETVAATFTVSLVPRLIHARAHNTAGAAIELAQAGLALVLAVMVVLTVALALAARPLLLMMGSSFPGPKLDLTVALFLSMLVWLPMAACSATWRAVLNAHGLVALSTAVFMAPPAITMLLLMAGGTQWGVWVLALSNTAGVALEFAVLAVAVRRLGYPLRFRWTGWTPEIRAIRDQYWPILAGTSITAGCGLVDQAVAGALGSGSVSALSYGVKVGGVLVAVGGTGMATAVLPEFSRLVSENRWDALRHAMRVHTGAAMAVMVPVTALVMWFSTAVVRLLYQGGQFDEAATILVAEVQRYSLMVVPFGVVLLIAQRLATAVGLSGMILRAGFLGMLVNIAGDLLLPRWIGVAGIALASTLAHSVFMAVLIILLYWKEPRLFRGVTR